MAEALGLGANVAAFVGLAGQVIQGCQYIKTIFDDIKDASDDIHALHKEINLLTQTLVSFKNILTEHSESGDHDGVGGETKLALDYCEEAMAGLLKSILKIKRSGSKWSQIRFAFSKDKVLKHVGRVERAKGYIAAAQASTILSMEKKRAMDTRATHQRLESLSTDINASSTIISTLPSRLDTVDQTTIQTRQDVKLMNADLTSRIHELSIGINKILSKDFSASITLVSQTNSHVDEVHHNAHKTQEAIETLGTTSEGLNGLPSGMLGMVKDTFRGSLVEFHFETSQYRSNQAMSDETSKLATNTAVDVELESVQQSSRTVLSQHTHVRRYIRAIGIITIYSTTTTFRDRDARSGNPATSTVTQTHVELFPNPEFLYMGVYCRFIQQGFATFPARIEPKLRVYHVVDSSAPIVRACANGDLQTVQQLFMNGEASPFDRMWRETSLLDLVMFRIVLGAKGGLPQTQLPKLLNLFKELVDYGLDPGMVRSIDGLDGLISDGRTPLFALSGLIHTCREELKPHLIDLSRTIVTKSVRDPLFNTEEVMDLLNRDPIEPSPSLLAMLLTQEEWPLTLEEVTPDSIVRCIRTGSRLLRYVNYQGYRVFFYQANVFYHDWDGTSLRYALSDGSLDEKLVILERISFGRAYNVRTGQPADKENAICLERRVLICLAFCIAFGFNPHEPPLRFYSIIERFRRHDRLDVLASALLQVGLEEEDINNLFEASDYASLAYQLKTITNNWMSFTGEIRYQEINLDSWLEFLAHVDQEILDEGIVDEEDLNEHNFGEEDHRATFDGEESSVTTQTNLKRVDAAVGHDEGGSRSKKHMIIDTRGTGIRSVIPQWSNEWEGTETRMDSGLTSTVPTGASNSGENDSKPPGSECSTQNATVTEYPLEFPMDLVDDDLIEWLDGNLSTSQDAGNDGQLALAGADVQGTVAQSTPRIPVIGNDTTDGNEETVNRDDENSDDGRIGGIAAAWSSFWA